MKKKVKKFGRGGDILTALGAGLAGYGAYKYLTKDNQGKDTKTGLEAGIKAGEKANEEKEVEKKAPPKREEYVAADKEENDAKKNALSRGMQYKKPEGPAAQDVSGRKAISVAKKKDDNIILPATDTYAGATKPSAAHAAEINKIFKDVDDPNKGKYRNKRADASIGAKPGKNAYRDSSGTIYNERGEPFATSKTVTGASNPNKKGAGRSRYPASTETPEPPKKGVGRSRYATTTSETGMKKGGAVKSASSRADGIAIRGKTRA